MKKVKGTVRRSHRAGKGSGGAADQLQKIGNVITTVQSKKSQDVFKDAGEELNPMVPESPTKRVKKGTDSLGMDMLTLIPNFQMQKKTVIVPNDESERNVFFFVDICAYSQHFDRSMIHPRNLPQDRPKVQKLAKDLALNRW